MPADTLLRWPIGHYRNLSDGEIRKREDVLRVAEHHFTAAEFAELRADLASGKLDVRLYDQGIVLMRTYEETSIHRC